MALGARIAWAQHIFRPTVDLETNSSNLIEGHAVGYTLSILERVISTSTGILTRYVTPSVSPQASKMDSSVFAFATPPPRGLGWNDPLLPRDHEPWSLLTLNYQLFGIWEDVVSELIQVASRCAVKMWARESPRANILSRLLDLELGMYHVAEVRFTEHLWQK